MNRETCIALSKTAENLHQHFLDGEDFAKSAEAFFPKAWLGPQGDADRKQVLFNLYAVSETHVGYNKSGYYANYLGDLRATKSAFQASGQVLNQFARMLRAIGSEQLSVSSEVIVGLQLDRLCEATTQQHKKDPAAEHERVAIYCISPINRPQEGLRLIP